MTLCTIASTFDLDLEQAALYDRLIDRADYNHQPHA